VFLFSIVDIYPEPTEMIPTIGRIDEYDGLHERLKFHFRMPLRKVVTVARARPQPRSSKPDPSIRGEESAIREFGFGSEPPTLPQQDVELLIERAMAESGEFPLGWSLSPPPTEKPTLLRPPAEADIEFCAARRTPILPIDAFSSNVLPPLRRPEIALLDPGPPALSPVAFSQRPTAPPLTASAASQRPTLAVRKVASARPVDPFAGAPIPTPRARAVPSYREPERALPEVEYLGPSTRSPAREIPQSTQEKRRSGTIRRLMSEEQLRALPLDHRAGFVLSMVGLVQTVDELLDISGMPRSEAMRLLCDLADLGAIDLG
jgi:hypothetical protein